jgi:formylglycine-generating enzyme required for sulfatase activity
MPCPEGKHREGTECVWDPCPEEHHREGSECVLDPCPTGTFRLGGTGRCIADGTWVTVRAGSFEMGSPASEQGHNDDETQHHVTLTRDYALLSTEVTQGQFEARMGYNPSKFAACGSNCPVEQVTWHEAAAYCNVLSAAGGYESCFSCGGSGKDVVCEPTASHGSPYQCPGYRLPTEAEWEHAARAGMATATYGGDLDRSHLECQRPNAVLDPIAWFCGNSGVTYDGAVDGREWGGLRAMGTHPVGGKGANPWGLHDMLGNVYEWCWDWYGEYAAGSATDPWGPAAGSSRAFRGGSWLGIARDARAASRYGFGPARRGDALGLRPSRSLP